MSKINIIKAAQAKDIAQWKVTKDFLEEYQETKKSLLKAGTTIGVREEIYCMIIENAVDKEFSCMCAFEKLKQLPADVHIELVEKGYKISQEVIGRELFVEIKWLTPIEYIEGVNALPGNVLV